MNINVVNTEEGFLLLKDDWNNIVQSDIDLAITNSWEWLYAWWEVFKADDQLYILVLDVDGIVVGIAPFYIKVKKFLGIFRKKTLQFLGSGEEEADEICSDYLDLIITDDYRAKVIDKIADYLLLHNRDWSDIELTDVRVDSENIKLLIETVEKKLGKKAKQISEAVCPYVELPEKWEILKEKTRINAREQLNRKTRLLEKEGEVSFVVYAGEKIDIKVFDRFIALHQSRWEYEGKPGCFSSEKFTSFHKNLIFKWFKKQFGIFYFLLLDGEDIAARYCFNFKGRVFDYQSGVDMSVNRKLASGFILLSKCLEDSINQKADIYDFFKGKKNGYKYKWTDKDIRLASYLIK